MCQLLKFMQIIYTYSVYVSSLKLQVFPAAGSGPTIDL